MLAEADVREPIFDRQVKVPGFDLACVRQTGVFSFGAGGLFGQQARGLVRKGYARIGCADGDVFTPSNYPRQLCYGRDLYQNKAVAVIRNLAYECLSDTDLWGYPLHYPDVARYIDWDKFDVLLCNVDNNLARVRLSMEGRARNKIVIYSAVSNDAGNGYVFIQENKAESPCFGCAFPHKINDKKHPCPGTPACVDILTMIGSVVLYALDSAVMNRPRFWNMRWFYLDGSLEDRCLTIPKNPNCLLCKTP
jgi:molybdopterin/thiamine biosynthesis adenylyltransferase